MLKDLYSLYTANSRDGEAPSDYFLELKRKALLKGRDLRVMPARKGFNCDEFLETKLEITARDMPYKISKATVGYFGIIKASWRTSTGECKTYQDVFFHQEITNAEVGEVGIQPLHRNFTLCDAELPSSFHWQSDNAEIQVEYFIDSMVQVCEPDRMVLCDKTSFEVYYHGHELDLDPLTFPNYPGLQAHLRLQEPYYTFGDILTLNMKLEGSTLPKSIHGKFFCSISFGKEDDVKANKDVVQSITLIGKCKVEVDGPSVILKFQIPEEGPHTLRLPHAKVIYGILLSADEHEPNDEQVRFIEVHGRPAESVDRLRITPHQRNYQLGDSATFTVTSVPTDDCATLITSLLYRVNGNVLMCHPISSTKQLQSQDFTVKIGSDWLTSEGSRPECTWTLEADLLDGQGNVVHSAAERIYIHPKPFGLPCCSMQ